MNLPTLKGVDLKGKKVLLRCDLNVPLSKDGKIADDTRILESIPTIRYILQNGGKIILMTHLGRPDGRVREDLRVNVIAERLSEILGIKVIKLDECVGANVEEALKNMIESDVYLLENTRFYPEEEKNEPGFAKALAALGDLYVNDAFGTVHRAHASTAGINEYLPGYAGLLLEKEISIMSDLLIHPVRPLCLIVGGAKVDTKIGVLNNFLEIADYFLIGGALANTFLAAKGLNIGSSLFEKEKIEVARKFLLDAEMQNKKVLLPTDVVVAGEISGTAAAQTVHAASVGGNLKILDIGAETIESFISVLKDCGTIIWNGPLGLYEFPQFENGTKKVAEFVSGMHAKTIIGGGDTIDGIKKFKIPLDKFTHVSTGGGAMLEFLEGKDLPGIQALMRK